LRSYEKILLVPILACLAALALIFAATLDYPTRFAGGPAAGREAGSELARDAAADNKQADNTQGREADAVANGEDRRTQDPRAGDASSYLLCSPEAALSWVVDPRTRTAVAADEAGHLAFYGGAADRAGTLSGDSYEILSGCLPQLAYTNHATVLVEGRGPEAASLDTLRSKTRRTADDTLVTSFSFAGGVRLDQSLSLQDGSLRADYTLTNDARQRTSVSLRTFVTPTADLGPSRDGRVARFIVDPGGGQDRRPVETEREIDGAEIGTVRAPRTGVPSDSSGRLLFASEGEGRRPDLVAFAPTLDLTATQFRYAQAQRPSAWPLPPASSMAVYWLYEDIPAGGSTTFSYRYEPVPPESAD